MNANTLCSGYDTRPFAFITIIPIIIYGPVIDFLASNQDGDEVFVLASVISHAISCLGVASIPPKYTPCYFLLPLTYNDGSRVEKEMRDKIEDKIFIEFGGWRITDTRRGGYLRRDDGKKQVEITQRIREMCWAKLESKS